MTQSKTQVHSESNLEIEKTAHAFRKEANQQLESLSLSPSEEKADAEADFQTETKTEIEVTER